MASQARRILRVAATREGVRHALEGFDRFSTECAIRADESWPFRVAIDEILSNVLEHAGLDPGMSVEVAFGLSGSELELTVADSGPEFDPTAVPPPDVDKGLADRQPGGLGVHLVKGLMDRVTYERRDGRNWLVCARRVGGRPATERS